MNYTFYIVLEKHKFVRLKDEFKNDLKNDNPIDVGIFEVVDYHYDSLKKLIHATQMMNADIVENRLFDNEQEAYKCAVELTLKKLAGLSIPHGRKNTATAFTVNSQSKFRSGKRSGIYTDKEKVVELSVRKEAQTMSDKNKHMDYEDRLEIQECLNKGMTFKAIGERIGKDKTTV